MRIDDTNKKRATPTELNELFEVSGSFYSLPGNPKGYDCRKLLRISRKQAVQGGKEAVDAAFIMMNPGSSKPVDSLEQADQEQELVPTKPDDTQFQLMRLMNVMNWNTVDVINLSDFRAPKSEEFFRLCSSLPAEHTIFHANRLAELEAVLRPRLIVAAWGVSSNLESLSTIAIRSVASLGKILVGLKGSSAAAYLHPQPFSTPKQERWISDMSEMLRSELQ